MAHAVGAITTVASGYHTSVGRPKRLSKSWNSVMKRIYVTEGTLIQFHNLKNSKGIDSDDSALRYLLDYYRVQVQESLESPTTSNCMPRHATGIAPTCSTSLSSRTPCRQDFSNSIVQVTCQRIQMYK